MNEWWKLQTVTAPVSDDTMTLEKLLDCKRKLDVALGDAEPPKSAGRLVLQPDGSYAPALAIEDKR